MRFQWKPCQHFVSVLLFNSMKTIILITGGPMDGQRVQLEGLPSWPPPGRLAGEDLWQGLFGVYVLQEATDGSSQPHMARYSLRTDNDFKRIHKNMSRYRVLRSVAELKEKFS